MRYHVDVGKQYSLRLERLFHSEVLLIRAQHIISRVRHEVCSGAGLVCASCLRLWTEH